MFWFLGSPTIKLKKSVFSNCVHNVYFDWSNNIYFKHVKFGYKYMSLHFHWLYYNYYVWLLYYIEYMWNTSYLNYNDQTWCINIMVTVVITGCFHWLILTYVWNLVKFCQSWNLHNLRDVCLDVRLVRFSTFHTFNQNFAGNLFCAFLKSTCFCKIMYV